MEHQAKPATLIDAVIHDIGDLAMTAKLDMLNAVVPWDKLAVPILATYSNATDAGDRPNVPPGGGHDAQGHDAAEVVQPQRCRG